MYQNKSELYEKYKKTSISDIYLDELNELENYLNNY